MAQFDAEYRLSNIMDGVQGFRVDGAAFHEYLGSAVSAGDVNGDGFADLIIGAQGQGGGNGGGYVVYGAAGGFSSHFDVSTLVPVCRRW